LAFAEFPDSVFPLEFTKATPFWLFPVAILLVRVFAEELTSSIPFRRLLLALFCTR
jgi:hypothetical protein